MPVQRPQSPAQRHDEICRAYFHDGSTADQLAEHFQLHVDTVRASVRDFAGDPDVNPFCAAVGPGRNTSPKRAAIPARACVLRRPGNPLGDIRAALLQEGFDVSKSYRFRVLRRAGLTTTRPQRSTPRPGAYAHDSRASTWCPRSPLRPTTPTRPNGP